MCLPQAPCALSDFITQCRSARNCLRCSTGCAGRNSVSVLRHDAGRSRGGCHGAIRASALLAPYGSSVYAYLPGSANAPGYAALAFRTPDDKVREAGRRSAALYGCGDGLIAAPGFRSLTSGPSSGCPNSKPRPAAMTCCGPHVPLIRSGTELAYVIANPQGAHRELRPSPVIAHPKVGGPTPASTTILTDGRSCSAPRNRQHTSTLPGGARHENYRTGSRVRG